MSETLADMTDSDIESDNEHVVLIMDGTEIDSIAELREPFVLEEAISYIQDRMLIRWLKQLYYEKEAAAVRKLRVSAGESFNNKHKSSMLDNNEILAVSKILLASRAFTKTEISIIIDKRISGCVPQKNRKLVSDIVSNEKYHYVQPRHNTKVIKNFGNLESTSRTENTLKSDISNRAVIIKTFFTYCRAFSCYFSEFYFYLLTYTVKQDNSIF